METTLSEGAAVTDVLRNEHQTIKELFRRFDDATSDRQKKAVGDACLRRIDGHIILKEDVFYPAVRRYIGERQRVVQALAALQVAKLLIKELKSLPGGEHYNARFELLKENVIQHFDEENVEMIPLVEKSEMDVEELGERMIEMKSRVSPFQMNGFNINAKTVGAVAAGAAVLGVAAWLAGRFNSEE